MGMFSELTAKSILEALQKEKVLIMSLWGAEYLKDEPDKLLLGKYVGETSGIEKAIDIVKRWL